MNDAKKTIQLPDMKGRLSALWLFAILTYTYGDVVTLMDPVKHGSIQMTEGFLLGGAIFMMIPITMVLLSRILKYRASRLASRGFMAIRSKKLKTDYLATVCAGGALCGSLSRQRRLLHSADMLLTTNPR
ncbi:MAG: hypothetical protein HGB05_10795 [Chloroflexi bacterium]|nr:hypothetical protein [Chloroflexota bacterium]